MYYHKLVAGRKTCTNKNVNFITCIDFLDAS